MLTNPYPHNTLTARVQTDIPPEVKGLLHSHLPVKNFFQLIINNHIHNLVNDLEQFGISTPTANSAKYLAILCEPRPLSTDQYTRLTNLLGGTPTSTPSQVSPRVQHNRGGSELHPTASDAATKRTSVKKRSSK